MGGRDADLAFRGPVYLDVVMDGVPHLPALGAEVHATSLTVSPGGTATRALAAARLGVRTALLTRVGVDGWGDRLLAALGDEPELLLDGVQRRPDVDTPVSVAVVAGGDRTFVTYERPRWHPPAEPPGPPRLPRALHLDVAAPVPPWVADLRRRGAAVVGGIGYVDTPGWADRARTHVAGVDAFVLNDDEARRATGADTPQRAAAVLARWVPLAVVTRGPHGVVACDGGALEKVPALDPADLGPAHATPVLDTTGAGDVFTAALMAAGLQPWTLRERLRAAVVCSGFSVRRHGGASSARRWPSWAGGGGRRRPPPAAPSHTWTRGSGRTVDRMSVELVHPDRVHRVDVHHQVVLEGRERAAARLGVVFQQPGTFVGVSSLFAEGYPIEIEATALAE